MILSWCRLRCPVWAARYAGPAERKMSATSSEARNGSAARYVSLRRQHGQLVEWAGHGAYGPCRHLGVEGGVLQLRVAEQRLDYPDVDAVLEQVGGKAVAQRVRAD